MHNNTVNLYWYATAITTRHILCHDMVHGILLSDVTNLWKTYKLFTDNVQGIIKTGWMPIFIICDIWIMKSAVYHQFMVLFLYNAWMIRVSFSFLYSTLRMYFVYRMLYTISYLTQTKQSLYHFSFVVLLAYTREV